MSAAMAGNVAAVPAPAVLAPAASAAEASTPAAALPAAASVPAAPATKAPATAGSDEANEADEPLLLLLTLKEVFVYKIPPLAGSRGHHAADWDLDNPALTGQLRLMSQGSVVSVQLFQPPESSAALPQLFAVCPIRLHPDASKAASKLDYFMQAVTDSSRYFVLRLENEETKRHAYIGVGFQERQSAFDLRAAIDDELKRIARSRHHAGGLDGAGDAGAGAGADKAAGAGAAAQPLPPPVDRSLKEGETIKVKLKLSGARRARKASASASASASGGGGLLRPPGSAGIKAPRQIKPKEPLPTPDSVVAVGQLGTLGTVGLDSLSLQPPAAAPAKPAAPGPVVPATEEEEDEDEEFDFGDFQS